MKSLATLSIREQRLILVVGVFSAGRRGVQSDLATDRQRLGRERQYQQQLRWRRSCNRRNPGERCGPH